MEFKTTSRAAYERRKKAGKFKTIIREDSDGALVVPHFIRGNYGNVRNDADVAIKYEFMLTPEEVAEQDKAAHDAMMTRIRAARKDAA